ncbi:MAG: VirK/YbjX family protein [Acidaminococcaceae bacterium]|nr:VirK/YbjX family protein [Acidaminococcaceae bacterium]
MNNNIFDEVEMDTPTLKYIGKDLYKTHILKEWKRYVVFMTRCHLHKGQIGDLMSFFAATPLRKAMLEHTTSFVEQTTRAFFYKDSTWDERIAIVKHHIEYLENTLNEEAMSKLYARGERIRLWEDLYEEQPLTMDLLFHGGQRKEGCLSLVLSLGEDELYQIMFWLAPSPEDGAMSLWIGALQGTPNGSEVTKGLTKAFFGYRTKNLIFYGIRNVAVALGCKHLYAVSNAGYYAMNHVRRDRKLKTSLDDFWQECEGQACRDQRFFEMPIAEYRKSMEELKPSKRAQHRRRFAKMDEITESVTEMLNNYKK